MPTDASDASCPDLPLTFSAFVWSLAQSALVHLGEVANPETASLQADLPLARHTIDLLEMLECKTRGNLDEEERRMLGEVLYELRVKYVSATGSTSS
ncbi:MAG: DUF1844 domain-containing protein [Deltaproteobacteria bacterium]|nr:DUF1844 domain-containing protein [Deltaproteobacteria bacterium]